MVYRGTGRSSFIPSPKAHLFVCSVIKCDVDVYAHCSTVLCSFHTMYHTHNILIHVWRWIKESLLVLHSFTCDEDVKCAIITWLMQQVVRSVCLGWANWSHTMTSSSTVKGTMLRNNVPVTPSLCNVSFLNQTWSQMYGYYKLTLGSTFMSVTADLSQAVSNPYMIHYNNSTTYKDSIYENA
jgi:hypothetical protein